MTARNLEDARRRRHVRAAWATAVVLVSALALQALGAATFLDVRLSRPIGFLARRALDREPELDPRLKFVVLDDATVASQKLTELNLRSWASVLKGLAKEQPRIVIIDKVFQTPLRSNDTQMFIDALTALPMPVAAATYSTSQEIVGRPPLDLARPEFDLARYVKGGEPPAWLGAPDGQFAYGPNPDFIGGFRLLGSIKIAGELLAPAFLRPRQDRIIPHLAFHAARDIGFDGGRLVVDGRRVPVARDGSFLINLVPQARLNQKAIRLDHVIDRLAHGEDVQEIDPGDVVVFLPQMFTGGADFKDTVFGAVPGGYLLVSVVNSVMTGKWIERTAPALDVVAVLLLTLAGALIGATTSTFVGALTVTAATAAVALGGVALFVYASWAVPWAFLTLVTAASGLGNVVMRAWIFAREARRVSDALGGLVAPTDIQELLRNPQQLDLRPRNVRVTVMFIDLVGFSRLAETVPAEDLFLQLKSVLSEMRRIIHRHGGFIDRSIGDGLLCYFGYRPDGAPANGNHADEALACAVELQRRNLDLSLEAKKLGSVSYPMRIGLNTEAVCMGDLGDNDKIDFTVIGRGVNFAKRLESACDHFRIMLSVSTRKSLTKGLFDESCLHERFVQVKHHVDLLPAFEYDPLASLGPEKIEAMQHFWSLVGIQRKDARHGMSTRVGLSLKSPHGEGQLLNFSESGLAVLMNRYIACGAPIAFDFDDGTGRLAEQCRLRGLMPLQVEVRWGEVTPDGYLHGVTIKSATEENRRWLFEELRRLPAADEPRAAG